MRVEKRLVLKKGIKKLCYQILYTVIIVLIGLIVVKKNPDVRSVLKRNIYEKSFPFQKVHNIYDKYFGNLLSVKKNSDKSEAVFKEKVVYKDLEEYKDGIYKVKVKSGDNISFIDSGVIIYIGNKDDLGEVIVVEQSDGVEVTYSNIINDKYKVYDYVEKGDIIGNVKEDYFYLSLEKDGKYLDYKEYI